MFVPRHLLDLDTVGTLNSIHGFIAPSLDDNFKGVLRHTWLGSRRNLHLFEQVERHISSNREEVCEWQDQRLKANIRDAQFDYSSVGLTCVKIVVLAVRSLSTNALSNSGSTDERCSPAFRNRCKIRSPM